MTESTTSSLRRGFRSLLPPWWGVVFLDMPLGPQVRSAVDRMVADLESQSGLRVSMAQRRHLESAYTESLEGLKETGALVWLYEAEAVEGFRSGMTMVVLPMPCVEGVRPVEAVLSVVALEADVTVFDAEDAPEASRAVVRVRKDSSATAELTEAIPQVPRPVPALDDLAVADVVEHARVGELTYYLGDPDLDDGWIIAHVAFDVQDGPDKAALLDAMTELCDQVVRSMTLVLPERGSRPRAPTREEPPT